MQIKALTQQKSVLYPAAVAVSAVLSACQQQTGGQVSPGAPPASFTADVAAASAECTIPASVRSADKDRQRLPGKKHAP